MLPPKYAKRVKAFEAQLEQLLAQPMIRFEHNLSGGQGVYRVSDPDGPVDETIRAGSTLSFRQRMYANHLMGNQSASLNVQLSTPREGEPAEFADRDAAKHYIREKLVAQFLPIADYREMLALEEFILAVLQPRYSRRKKPA